MCVDDNTKLIVRAELDSKTEVFTKRLIIAGFPGVGKSTAAINHPHLFLDMESSDYHWIINGDNSKICNPEWPMNYVDAILNVANRIINDKNIPFYICISTHSEVLRELDKRCIYYVAVLPKSKDLYIQRYKDRGNDEAFINLLNNKFDDFIKDVESSSAFCIYYTDGYLADIYVPNDVNEEN